MKRIITILIFLGLSTVVFSQQPDSVKTKIIRQWSLSKDFTEEVELPFDTLFSLFNRYRLTDRYSSLNATPGSYGLPFYQLNFFDRITDPDKYLLSSFYPLAWQPDRYIFMNTQGPFTEFR